MSFPNNSGVPSALLSLANQDSQARAGAGGGIRTNFQSAGNSAGALGQDLSQTVFYPSVFVPPSEFLAALPRVRATRVQSRFDTMNPKEVQLYATVQGPSSDLINSGDLPLYSTDHPVQTLQDTANGPAIDVRLARLGYRIPAMLVDQLVIPPNASTNPDTNRLRIATTKLLAYLSWSIGSGKGSFPFAGLNDYATAAGRVEGSSGLVDEDAITALLAIRSRGTGLGAGPDALVCDERVVGALMKTPAGQTGASGWRYDPRTNMNIYHFMGVPVYRAQIEESGGGGGDKYYPSSSLSLFAVNFGSDGIRLIYAYGSAESMGIQVDKEQVRSEDAATSYLVHGAWGLMVGDPMSVYKISDVSV